ncbi:MAG: hypothetical protein LKJ86_05565 [Oscillibacter sp.]|jgi:hypothetical protein|nr:hypothetical protein [Oscillibacter sp.]
MADKRVRRTAEELAAEADRKIELHKHAIAELEQRKKKLLNPKPRISKAAQMKKLLDKARKSGMSPDEIAQKLGFGD